MFFNSSLLHYSSSLFILGLTSCLFQSVLFLFLSRSLVCVHSSLFTFSILFSLCYSSLSLISHCEYFHFPFSHFNSFFSENNQPHIVMSFLFYDLHQFSYTLNLQRNSSATELPNVQEL